jgi:membrane-anchored glycerophosphoryl diester phosphodiesterase (GDPDase)
MKDVIFEDENEDFQPRTVFQKIEESKLVAWLIKKGWAKTQYQGTVFLIILSIIFFTCAIILFLKIPPVYVPQAPVDQTQTGIISLPSSVK